MPMERQSTDEIYDSNERDVVEAAIAFEASAYPHATPETWRLLAHARSAIRKFLESDLGR